MFSPQKNSYYLLIIVFLDTATILVSFWVAYWLRFSGFLIPLHKGLPSFEYYLRAMVVVVPIHLIIFRWYRLYQLARHIRRIQELINVVKAVTCATFIFMAVTFTYREFSYSRFVLLFAWFFAATFCCVNRYCIIQFEYLLRKTGKRDRVLIIGANPNSRNLIRWMEDNPHYGQEVIGILSNSDISNEKHFNRVPILGSYEGCDETLKKENIDQIIVTDPSISREMISELMLKCESKMISFKLVADFYGLITQHVDVEYVSNVPLLGLKSLPLDDLGHRLLKRLFDIFVSASLLIIFSPILTLIGAAIKLHDRGQILYKQERVGQDGKIFNLYKFRTMSIDAENKTGPVWTSSNDQRVTLVGKFLRRINLDELPQLWNVLIGNMSMVGPRPERPYFVEQFRDQIPRYMARHKIKSGITGWAQIHGLRGNTSLEERIKYDLYYMENWTVMMDVEILLATLFAFKNAY